MRIQLFLLFSALNLSASVLFAQAPVAVPQQPTVNVPAAPAPAAPADTKASTAAVLQALQQMKSANDEMLKRQAATLLQIEEMEKAAEQIKVYTKRS